MPFVKGKPRPPNAGRKKGTPNKPRKSIFDSLEEIRTEDGSPLDIVKLLFDGIMAQAPFQRVDSLIDFMKFVYPQQRNVEISQPEGEGFKVEIVDYTKKHE